MTAGLVAVLVVLVGARLRVKPAPRDLTRADDAGTPRSSTPRSSTPRSSWQRSPSGERTRWHRAGIDSTHVAAWCDGLARAVGTGSTLVAAIREVEPPAECAAAVNTIRLALQRGAALQDACAIESGSVDLEVALTVLRACAAQGGPAAESLSRAAATLRGRAADAADRRTQSEQARLSAKVMTVLPVCMLALLLLTSGAVRGFAASPAGLVVVAGGAALNTAGWRWMAHLIEGHRR
jgi:Flp pilus assembly protein TadB